MEPVPQALMMINGDIVNNSANYKERGSFINYVLSNWRDTIDRVSLFILMCYHGNQRLKNKPISNVFRSKPVQNKDLAYEDLYWVLLNSAEFSLNH